jgi:Fe-S cluster biogenesis protein NfuA
MPYVTLDFTPNPKTLKYVTDAKFADRVNNFRSRAEAVPISPRVTGLFDIAGVEGVMVGHDFITVLRDEASDIEQLHDALLGQITSWANSGEVLSTPEDEKRALSEIEQRIADFIDMDVRPAVAKDGGNVVFEKFQEGVVYLRLEGSCQGCPSSVATLKLGIESRLRVLVPEVVEVVSV